MTECAKKSSVAFWGRFRAGTGGCWCRPELLRALPFQPRRVYPRRRNRAGTRRHRFCRVRPSRTPSNASRRACGRDLFMCRSAHAVKLYGAGAGYVRDRESKRKRLLMRGRRFSAPRMTRRAAEDGGGDCAVQHDQYIRDRESKRSKYSAS